MRRILTYNTYAARSKNGSTNHSTNHSKGHTKSYNPSRIRVSSTPSIAEFSSKIGSRILHTGFLGSLMLILTLTLAIPLETRAAAPRAEVIERVYNPNSGEHLYTTSEAEVTYLANLGWDDEGVGWVAPRTSTTPIYRIYNGIEHLYTTDLNEVNVLSSLGWVSEGIKFYSDANHTLPMYRLFNPNGGAGAHHYTRNLAEKDMLVDLGWEYEGIAWYAYGISADQVDDDGDEYYEHTIENTDCYAAIEADVKLSGEGSGYHAKLLFQTPESAVSFGIQYDRWAAPPYTDTTFFLCENVASNDKGGQEYTYHGTTYTDMWQHIMITYSEGGTVAFYVDGDLIGEVTNTGLDEDDLYFSAEGSARLEGDSVDATFANIKLKSHGVYDPYMTWPTYEILTNDGIAIERTGFDTSSPATGTVRIHGSVIDIGDNDWDSAYSSVSGVFRFGNCIRPVPRD